MSERKRYTKMLEASNLFLGCLLLAAVMDFPVLNFDWFKAKKGRVVAIAP